MSKSKSLKVSAKKLFTTRNMTLMAVMTALSVILYLFVKFDLPFFPSFLEMHFSELPAVLAGYMINPLAAIFMLIIRLLIKLPMTRTAGVGEVADLIVSLAFCLPANIIYYYKKSKKSAALGLIAGTLSAVFVAVVANAFLLVPYYVRVFYNGDWEKIVKVINVLYHNATKETFFTYYIPLAVVPFNLLRLGVCAVITFFSYKSLNKASYKIFGEKRKTSVGKTQNAKITDNGQNVELSNTETADAPVSLDKTVSPIEQSEEKIEKTKL